MRVKTVWFRKEGGGRPPQEIATVVASTIWRLAEKAVDNLSKADYDIVTPARGFRIMGEIIAFGMHYADRIAHARMSQEWRGAFVQAIGIRLAEIMQDNIRSLVGDDGYDYKADFIAMLNRRGDDYASFEFPEHSASYPALRYLAMQIREVMEGHDKPWVMDQIMDIEMPEAIGTLKKTLDGLLRDHPLAAGGSRQGAEPV